MSELRFGLIGLGHWGPNYARLLRRMRRSEEAAKLEQRAQAIRARRSS